MHGRLTYWGVGSLSPILQKGKPRLRKVKWLVLSLTACLRQNQVETGLADSKCSLQSLPCTFLPSSGAPDCFKFVLSPERAVRVSN